MSRASSSSARFFFSILTWAIDMAAVHRMIYIYICVCIVCICIYCVWQIQYTRRFGWMSNPEQNLVIQLSSSYYQQLMWIQSICEMHEIALLLSWGTIKQLGNSSCAFVSVRATTALNYPTPPACFFPERPSCHCHRNHRKVSIKLEKWWNV